MRCIILILMENELGVLFRVVGLFFQCGYNIEILMVVFIEDDILFWLIMIIIGDDKKIEQIIKYFNKLIEVVKLVDFIEGVYIECEIMFMKVKVIGVQCVEVKCIVDIFWGQIVDVISIVYMVQFIGIIDKLEVFINVVGEVQVLEVVCFGVFGILWGEKVFSF